MNLCDKYKVEIKLYRENWVSNASVSTIGWAAWQGKSYTGEALNQLITTLVGAENFHLAAARQLAVQLNGSFAIVIRQKKNVFLISDRTRSYPLLYIVENDFIYVTDHLLAAIKDYNLKLEPDVYKAEVFLLAGMTLQDHTVYRNAMAIQAAEIIHFDGGMIKEGRYFVYSLNTSQGKELSVPEEVERQNKIFTNVFRRTLESAPDVHNWILPLSGGHDSRMVINQLHKLGVKNLICYSYGKTGNEQSRLSEEVARKLGYPWYFIEYTPEKWRTLRESPDFDNYFDFAFNGVSDPHIQDFLAVSELKRLGIAQSGDIFMPGHTFDFLTGAYCQNGITELRTEKDIYAYLSNYFNQWEYKKRSKSIFDELSLLIKLAPVQEDTFSEYFHWQERHAKFLQNSVRVYEYFGFDWRTPLWDQELIEYWQTIPLEYKLYRNFLYLCEKNGLYEEPLTSVPFDVELRPAASFKEKLKANIPYSWKQIIKYYMRKETPQSDDALYTIYAAGCPVFDDRVSYNTLPKRLRRYLKPYRKRPLHWFPDNDNNSLYAIRNLFIK